MTEQPHIKQLNASLESIKENLETMDGRELDEWLNNDVLEIKVKASIDTTARSYTLVLTTGGPHIELNLANGTINGYWGKDERTRIINEKEAGQNLDHLRDSLNMMWEYNGGEV